MNTFCLENYGVSEMETREMKEANGGVFGWDDLAIAVITLVVAEIISDWDNFKAGLNGNCES